MKNITYLIALIIFALTMIYSGCATNADWGKYRGTSSNTTTPLISNKVITQQMLNSHTEQIKKEAKHMDMSVVSYLHAVNTNKIKRVTAHDLLPDPFLVSQPTKIIPRRTAQNKSFDWQGGVANVPNAKYVVKLENGGESETLYLSPTLEEARQYVKKYMPFHDDLYVYEKDGVLIYAPGNTINTGWARFE